MMISFDDSSPGNLARYNIKQHHIDLMVFNSGFQHAYITHKKK